MKNNFDTDTYCCPNCLGHFNLNNYPTLHCENCQSIYKPQDDGQYYDFYIPDENITSALYPPSLAYLFYNREMILSLTPPNNTIYDILFCRKQFNDIWKSQLKKLQSTVRHYDVSERKRVEYMVDDDTSREYKFQKIFTEEKSRIIMKYILSVKHNGKKVLHIGCGGRCNESIPIKYSDAGFINYGVEAVRSYVKEFSDNGEAHLANALSLPYKNESFDIINFTDIMEHLFDPLLGLTEANRVLKEGGYLMLDTPNQTSIRSYKNLLFGAENIFSRIFPKIPMRRKKIITGEWKSDVCFHTEFTKKELVSILSHAGFEIKNMSTHTYWGKRKIVGVLNKIAPKHLSWYVLAKKNNNANKSST